MIYLDEYQYMLRELFKRKTKPYIMANKNLSKDFFETFKKTYPKASIHFYEYSQFICLDDKARKNLIKQLKAQRQKLQKQIDCTINLINEVTANLKED